jgi:uncharacterized membrane protein (UPF0127 family)
MISKLVRTHCEILTALVLVVSVLAFGAYLRESRPPRGTLVMGGMVLRAEVVETPQAVEKGLSGRQSLAPDAAMLFTFDEAKAWCFWMKDMAFSLDIIWLDDSKRIVAIAPNLAPETYPQDYCPPKPARYVVEVNAGTAAQLGLKPGDQVSFTEE